MAGRPIIGTWRLANSARALQALGPRACRARDPGEVLGALAEARLAGLALGEALGVPAQLEAPPSLSKAAGLDPVLVKASGAGNELGMAFFGGRAVAADGFKELKATEGPLWLT
jgi:hypothetical protein